MNPKLKQLLDKIGELETELEAELAQKRQAFRYTLREKRVVWEDGALTAQRRAKKGLLRFFADARFRSILTSPVIYSLIVPLALLDATMSLYQGVCFPAYRISRVRRGDYVVFDHHLLAYLNAIEKLNCVYCGYGNGVLAYAAEIASRTEQYWCPIKHARKMEGSHGRYPHFTDYGDGAGFREKLKELRLLLEAEAKGEATPQG